MIVKESELGFVVIAGSEYILTGYPKAVPTDRFWSSGDEFRSYVTEHELDGGIRILSEATAFHARGTKEAILEFLHQIESHFGLSPSTDEETGTQPD